MIEKLDDVRAIEQITVKEHVNVVTCGELRLWLENAQMNAADGPQAAWTADHLASQSRATLHGAAHPPESRCNVRCSTTVYDSEKAGQLTPSDSTRRGRSIAENTSAARNQGATCQFVQI